MKIDNKSMEMEIESFRRDRRTYSHNISSIEALKHDITNQIKEKKATI